MGPVARVKCKLIAGLALALPAPRRDARRLGGGGRGVGRRHAARRAAAERDVKIARIENIRANTRVKAINKVLKQLVAKYIESKKALKTLEVTCMNQTKMKMSWLHKNVIMVFRKANKYVMTYEHVCVFMEHTRTRVLLCIRSARYS